MCHSPIFNPESFERWPRPAHSEVHFFPPCRPSRRSDIPRSNSSTGWVSSCPAKTPAETVGNLNNAIREVLKKDEVKAAFTRISYEISAASGADFAGLIKSDFERWGPIVKASGYKPED
jgi:hypothetical protein